MLAVCAVLVNQKRAKQNEINAYNEYIDNMTNVSQQMLSGAASAEAVCNKVSKIWNAAIFDNKKSWDSDISKYKNLASREDAEAAFDAWKASIPEDRAFEPFRALARIVENHREYIFNYWDCSSRISNGYTECANRLINEMGMKGRGYSFETLRARTLYRRQNLDRIIASNGLAIGPRVDAPGPLFVTEPDHEGEAVDDFLDPRSGAKIDAKTGGIL